MIGDVPRMPPLRMLRFAIADNYLKASARLISSCASQLDLEPSLFVSTTKCDEAGRFHLHGNYVLSARLRLLTYGLLTAFLPLCMQGQQSPLPPVPPARSTSSTAAPQAQFSSISAIVTDSDGASVFGARVTLIDPTSKSQMTARTDKDGWFTFAGVAPGRFTLTVAADGFANVQFSGLVEAARDLSLPNIKLRVEAVLSDVQVSLSRQQQAEIDVKAEETQHVLYFLPNFFTVYDWHALPLSAKQKYELAFRSTIDPGGNLLNAGIAGVYQALNTLPGYHQGASGYFKRLGAVNADAAISVFAGGAILPSLLHQDPRYFYMGEERGSISARVLYAARSVLICRGDNSRTQFNYSNVIGDFASGAASNLYYPVGSRNSVGLTFRNGALGLAGNAVGNLFQEFVVRHLTPRAPKVEP